MPNIIANDRKGNQTFQLGEDNRSRLKYDGLKQACGAESGMSMNHSVSASLANVLRGPLRTGVSAIASVLIAALVWTAAAQAQQSVAPTLLGKGNAIITGFSGTAAAATPAPSGDPTDSLFIDLNGASMRLQDISTGGQLPQGQLIASPTVFQAKSVDVGQVFGIALDDGRGPDGTQTGAPDIFLSASSAFGLQIVQPDASGNNLRLRTGNPGAQWMAGQWGGADKQGGPGSIWKVSGTTGQIGLFANVILNGQPNRGPGLGNLAFDPKSRQIFVSDLSTGMIHRLDMHGVDLGTYDHGIQGRASQGLAPVADDPANRLDIANPLFNSDDAATWHYAPKGRMVWGVKVSGDRLYYAAAEGPQVWSISIGQDGSFGNDPRLEIDVIGTPNNNAISDVTFDGPDTIYLAQRGAAHGDYSYKTFADPAKSSVIRYHRDPQTGKWTQHFEEYAVGFPPENRNTNGGVAIDRCNTLVWTTGELLRVGSGLSGPEVVHGLQGMDKGLVRPGNVPPTQSYYADYDGQFNDPDVHGHMGDVEIWHPCRSIGVVTPPLPPIGDFNLTLTKDATPFYCPPGFDCIPHPQNPQSTDCVQGGGDWLCSYRITVKNTGSVPYAGPLTVHDWLPSAPAGATMTFAPQPPWFCSQTGPGAYDCVDPMVTLNPGDSIELDVVVDLPSSYPYCYLENAAFIDWPDGYGDANPADDAAYTSAHIPGAYCPPPQGNKTNLWLQKFAYPYCKPWQGAYLCGYLVKVTNTGPGVYSDKIVVADTLPAGDIMIANSAPWNCAGGPPTYQCTHPTVTLNPGQSRGFFVWVKTPFNVDKPECDVTNHAHISFAPGGSDENSNPGDDDASATAHIPSDKCFGQKTNLKIEKLPGKCVRYDQNGEGWDCNYLIKVTNTGPSVFSGEITAKDTFGGQAVPQNWPAPWTCQGAAGSQYCTHPAVTLNPGGNVWVMVSGKVDETQVKQGQCKVTNEASINAPAGGSKQNSDPNDDQASATDTVPDPHCQSLLAPAKNGHVSIEKVCKPSVAGAAIDCTIEVTNDGGQPISSAINFVDQGQWTGNGGPMHVLSAKPNNPAVSCGGLPDHLACSVPGAALAPGAQVAISVVLAASPGDVTYRNCATLVSANGSPLTGSGHETCVTGGGEITVIKTGPASCVAGETCTFQINITNSSEAAYSGPVLVGDALFIGYAVQSGQPFTVSPPFGCASEPAALPFNCVTNASLGGHEQHIYTVKVRLPADIQSASKDGLNCFFATDGSDPAASSDRSRYLAGFGPHAGNGPGYSCIAFKVESAIKTCPGELKRIGTQCKCPDNLVQGPNYTCHSSTRVLPVPLPIPLPLPTKCPDGSLKSANPNCYTPPATCPDGSLKSSNPNCNTPPATCSDGSLKSSNPHCCPGNLPYWNGSVCTRPPVVCRGGQVSNNEGGCACPKDLPFLINGVCSRLHTIFCRLPLVSQPNGTCGCPNAGDIFANGRCSPPKAGNTDGNGNPPACAGVIVNGVCIVKLAPKTTQTACPRPATGFLPNCTCPARMTWNGSTCIATVTDGTKAPQNGAKGSDASSCPKGQHWNGKVCAADSILKKLNIPGLGNIFKSN